MRRLLIDTDCGTDDACAIMLAVRIAQKESDVEIEAITTCYGNVPLAKVRPNVLRVLKLCDATEIPVIGGADRPLVQPFRERRVHLHDDDGFGGLSGDYPAPEVALPEEHAATAMVRLAREFKGELTVVALGPLTNVALAQKLDPKFFSNLKGLVVLGGVCNDSDHGPNPGFNFNCDPEALSIVVNESNEAHKLKIVTPDACRNYPLAWSWFDSLDETNKYISFLKGIMSTAAEDWRSRGHPGFFVYDLTVIAIYLEPAIASRTLTCPIRVKLNDGSSPGTVALDRRSAEERDDGTNADVCSELNTDLLKLMYERLM